MFTVFTQLYVQQHPGELGESLALLPLLADLRVLRQADIGSAVDSTDALVVARKIRPAKNVPSPTREEQPSL